jgi:hypothetical protein
MARGLRTRTACADSHGSEKTEISNRKALIVSLICCFSDPRRSAHAVCVRSPRAAVLRQGQGKLGAAAPRLHFMG